MLLIKPAFSVCRPGRVLLLVLLWLSPTEIISAQEPKPKADAPDVPALRVSTHLVQLNVIVNDKHGNPITGLAQQSARTQVAMFT